MIEEERDPTAYEGRRTLIVGDVNTGKSRLTAALLEAWTARGRSRDIAVLDLAPEARGRIGGRIALPAGFQGLVMAPPIVPPRLQARNEEEAQALAEANAAAIAPLLRDHRLAASPILVVNDVTLYLQAGPYDALEALVRSAPTVVLNAYYGNSFPEYRLSRRERRLTERLMDDCDRIVRLPIDSTPSADKGEGP